ncbi:transketolase C-terminal domain-containing protein [Leptospirillum ferriphilum]|jgi:pyruvate ferredoxin oxidoreductase alpha subunit|uniref:Pyruvate:ferredoxin oxidoreductase, alpha subunit n=2 Tax=Leptospirillum TaxID=179 RepID=A0A094X876_9BACT|nr:transketolase C-terminal domain-containing protein [Leptospirillum ferriphilum]EDZ39968.1 MAG: Pyruvate synthase alpha chain [Leptospirillum sp. Group II '5-way CG']KGA94744.1 Pyruvate:ferredoxin oxidoreductase, alpha subunit [Leptospirillum ferriphilum]
MAGHEGNGMPQIGSVNKKGQIITDPQELFFLSPRSQAFLTGSEVIKEAVKRASVDFSVAYPITPQSEASSLVGELFADGYVGDYMRGESEFAVMGECAGGAFGGARVFTTTAGPGTLRAFENFPMWAGSRLPIEVVFTVRGVNSPLSIQPDTLEIAFMLETGMLLWHAETAQDLFDYILKGYIVAEKPEVHLPIGVIVDGFFVTHTKDMVMMTPENRTLPHYNPYASPVTCMDMESPPVRMMRDPFVMKSNYISYMTHASWQLEVRAAIERSRKHTIPLLDGLIEVENPDAEIMIVSSGTAVSQGREAIRLFRDQGIKVGLVKIKTIRPFPEQELRAALKNAKHIFVPEFNIAGWMAKEIKAILPNNERVVAGPHVAGGMTMPPEIIVEEIEKSLAMKGKKELIHG